MDILRFTIASLVTATLLVGCGDKSSTTDTTNSNEQPTKPVVASLSPTPQQGDHKQYWIQSYSVVSKDKIDWSNKNRVATQLLVNYQVEQITEQAVELNVTSQHTELQVKGNAAYPHPVLQDVLRNGIRYQLKMSGDTPLTITENNPEIKQQIVSSSNLNSEYCYLKFVMTAPFFPTAIPLEKGQQVTLHNFLDMQNLQITVNDLTQDELDLTLQGTTEQGNLYGKAVIDRTTGWLKRMALVKEAPVTARTDYKMRTILLIGPTDWSSSNNRQLLTEMHIEETKQYLQPFPIFGFDQEGWQQAQQRELATSSTEGKLFNLNTADGATQLMLIYKNNTGSSANSLGKYRVTDLVTDNQKQTDLLPAANIEFNIPGTTKEINVATYKPLHNDSEAEPIKLDEIKTVTAKVNFIPYQLETLVLPIAKETRTVRSQAGDFSVDISPTDQKEIYILHWQAKDNVNFGAGLITGAENALVQYILPDTEAWLTPIESRIVNSISNGYENRTKIAFTNEPPVGLEIHLLKQSDQAGYSNQVTFKRK